ncbi:uncharacterized protein LOC127858353 isoform X9 [Dreissena polymorpha]|uniref:uncharacterized protein LOC127858353 isoform X9 n=1 Tax=Dreissena polymorpha TaxID=45954 RepID=UPI00226449C5|nr:uncharacterized protein LOC127858353 isoform X9 [Dreissena polymorpha]
MADMSSSQTSNSNNLDTAAKKRKRGPNYTASELAVLEEEFSANRSLLESNLSDKVTHAQLKHCWQQIADKVNSVGHHFRSGTEIKEKWRQMVKKAKKEFSEFKKESTKTGGGRPPSNPPSTSSRIIEMYKDTAGFSGIPGAADLETFIFQDGEVLNHTQTGVTGEFILDFILEQTGEDTVNEQSKSNTVTRNLKETTIEKSHTVSCESVDQMTEKEKVQKTTQVSSDNSRTRTNERDSSTYDPCSSKQGDAKKKSKRSDDLKALQKEYFRSK